MSATAATRKKKPKRKLGQLVKKKKPSHEQVVMTSLPTPLPKKMRAYGKYLRSTGEPMRNAKREFIDREFPEYGPQKESMLVTPYDRWAYYRSLRNPADIDGGVIPDDFPIPTVKVICRTVYTATGGTAANDRSAAFFAYPAPKHGLLYTTDGPTPGTLAGAFTRLDVDQYTEVSTALYQYRPIGMKIYIEYSQALTAAQGDVTFGLWRPSTTMAGLSLAALKKNALFSKTIPLSACTPKQAVLWSPLDENDEAFGVVSESALLDTALPSSRKGLLCGILFDNMTPYTTAAITYAQIVVETCFECMPAMGYAFLIGARPHVSDPIGQAKCTNRHRKEGFFLGFD